MVSCKFIGSHSVTRENRYKLTQKHVHYNLTKFSFANRVVSIWKVMFVGSSSQLQAASGVTTVSVAVVSLPVSSEIKSLCVVIYSRLTFEPHVKAVCKAWNYHTWAFRHVRHCLPLPVAQTLACSIVGSQLDNCYAVLFGAPKSSIAKLQRAQNMLATTTTTDTFN